MVNSVLHINLQKDSWEVLFHKPIEGATKRECTLVTHIFSVMKQMIAKVWKMPLLYFTEAKSRVHSTLVNEKLTTILTETHDNFLRTWQPWLYYFPLVQLPTRFLEL